MNYQKKYNDLIKKAQTTAYTGPTHMHHIKPASLCRISKRYKILSTFVWDCDADESSNLVALSPREHYIAHLLLAKIHGHKMWFALNQLSKYAKNSRLFEISANNIKNIQKDKWKNKTHNLYGMNEKRLSDGTHNFVQNDAGIKSSNTQNRLVAENRHHFMSINGGSEFASNRNKLMIELGTHVSVNENAKEKFKNTRKNRMNNGDWHTCGVKPWNNNSSKEKSKEIYSRMDTLHALWMIKQCGSRKLATLCGDEWSQTHENIINMFKSGFVPSEDVDWLMFKSKYQQNIHSR